MHFWDPKLQLWRSRCAGVSIHPLKQTERKSPHESFTFLASAECIVFWGAYDLVRSVLLRLVFVSITLCDHINLSPGAPVPWFSLAVIPAVAASRQGAGTHNDAHIELLVAGICNFLNVFKYVCCPKQIASHLSFTHHISSCVIRYHQNKVYFF